jgi:hypothetical protein
VLFGSANAPGLGNAINWRLGGDGTSLIGGFDGWAGELDFVLFYNRVLTDDQVQAILSHFVIPEPATLTLVGLGLAMAERRRRRRKA